MNPKKTNKESETSSVKKTGFVLFQSSEDDLYYFQFNDENGEPMFFSGGHGVVSRRDKNLESVKKYAAIPKMYKVLKEGKQFYFILRAGNYLEIGRSKAYSNNSEMKKAMKYFSENAAETQPKTSSKSPAKAMKKETKKRVDQSDEQFALKYSYQIHLYPNSEGNQINGRIINARTERKMAFNGLNGQAITEFMKEDLIGNMPSLSLTSPTEENSPTPGSEKVKSSPKGIAITDPSENLTLKILNKKTGKASNNLLRDAYYDLQVSLKENTKTKALKTKKELPFELSIKAITGSNFSNIWTENLEISSEGMLRLTSLPRIPYPGIYRMTVKSQNTESGKILSGNSVVNIV